MRCERELEWQGERRTAITVGNADGWWYRDPRFEAEFFDEQLVGVELPELALFDPWEVARRLTFASAKRTTHSTRDAVRARADPRGSGSLLTPGADRYELAVDAEHGVILTLTALSDEIPIEVHEIVDLAFDEDLDPELFRLEGAPEPSERSPTPGRPPRPILCSFCGKSQREVVQLIAGPGVYICDQCLDLCNEIVREARGPGQA